MCIDWDWSHVSLQQPLHQSIPTVVQALAEVMRKMQDFQDTRKIAWRKTWWETLHLLESEMGGLKFAFGSTDSPFTKILVEIHRVLKIIEPGRPPSDLKSPFIESLMQQVVALTNIGASLAKSRKLSKEEQKVQGRLQWARGARDRLLNKQKTMGLPPPKNSQSKVLTHVLPTQKTAMEMKKEFEKSNVSEPAFSSSESGNYLVQRGGDDVSQTVMNATAGSIYDSVGM